MRLRTRKSRSSDVITATVRLVSSESPDLFCLVSSTMYWVPYIRVTLQVLVCTVLCCASPAFAHRSLVLRSLLSLTSFCLVILARHFSEAIFLPSEVVCLLLSCLYFIHELCYFTVCVRCEWFVLLYFLSVEVKGD